MVGISEYGILAGTRASSLTLTGNEGEGQHLTSARVPHGSDKARLNQQVRADFQRALTEAFGQKITDKLGFNALSSKALSAKAVRQTLRAAEKLAAQELKSNADTLLAHFSQRVMGGHYDAQLEPAAINVRGLHDYAQNILKEAGRAGLHELTQEKIVQFCDALAQKCAAAQDPQGVELLNMTREQYNSEELNLKPGDPIGIFEFVKSKEFGVEPGFDGTKAWLPCHDEQLLQGGTKLNDKALDLVDEVLSGRTPGRTAEQRTQLASKAQELRTGLEALRGSLNLPQSLSDLQKRELLAAALDDPGLKDAVKGLIKGSDPYFTTIEHVKMDYAENDISMGKVRIPRHRAKGVFHRLFTAKTKSEANMGAIKETLASDLMRAMGINAQKAKLVPASYADGSLKLMISSEHMHSEAQPELPFKTLQGHIVDGVLVKSSAGRDAAGNSKNIVQSDEVIEGWGRNKILMLMLADRDAIGSRGDNKGRLGNEFAAIDPGHSLEGYMSLRNVNSDFSFSQPHSTFTSMNFKNFTVFDDSTYQEKMEGVKQLADMRAEGKDTAVFDSYINYFEGEMSKTSDAVLKKEYGAYAARLEELRESFIARRDYILDEVFAERLPFADEEPYVLGALDMLEKLTSPVRQTSKNGEVQLRHLQLKDPEKRTAWHIARSGDGYVFSTKGSLEMRERVEAFLTGHQAAASFRLEDGELIVNVSGDQAAAFCEALKEDNVRAQVLSPAKG